MNRRTILQIAFGSIFLQAFEYVDASAAPNRLPGFASFMNKVKIARSSKYYLVESDGLPDHEMMAGILSWQQQIPIPQPYFGKNAWPIPAKPIISNAPITSKNRFLRGAIAVAVNGVPIFNPLNNRGEDSFLIGELDNWGGHCGRADDYHYHIAPFHLQEIAGIKSPIAYALDGYPIYGETEIDGKPALNLDELGGHFDKRKKYHYHSRKTYPYINGGFKGVVHEIDGQVSPQSATRPFRAAGEPLRGAKVISCQRLNEKEFSLIYEFNGSKYEIRYSADFKDVNMSFISPDGSVRSEKYARLG